MELLIATAQIIGGLALLFFGGNWLVKGSVALAHHLGMSTMAIGLTIVAYGTSSPELFVSAQAAFTGHSDIAIGNVVGSNIANILLVIGASALIWPIALKEHNIAKEAFFLLGISVLLYAICTTGEFGRMSALLFVLLIIGFSWIIFRASTQPQTQSVLPVSAPQEIASEVEEYELEMPTWKAIAYIIVGIAGLLLGANMLIPGAVFIAQTLGLSEALIGVTVIAIGGSAPELATSLIAAFRKESAIAIGNVIGSNLFNTLGALGVAGLIAPLDVSARFVTADLPSMLAATLLFTLLLWKAPSISRPWGAVLMLGYLGYIGAQFFWLG